MGGDHGHGHGKVVIPDWKIYKVEDVPELMQVQKALAQKGLRDPWLRNEVWRFNPAFGTTWSRGRRFFLRGIGYGTIAFIATIAVEQVLGIGKSHHDGHH